MSKYRSYYKARKENIEKFEIELPKYIAQQSRIREECHKLMAGEAAVFDVEGASFYSAGGGAYAVGNERRIFLDTNIVSQQAELPFDVFEDLTHVEYLIKSIGNKFVDYEEQDLYRRLCNINNYEEVIYGEKDPKKLQKWFNDLGKNVLVLKENSLKEAFKYTGKLLFIERTPVAVRTMWDEYFLSYKMVIWEDFGFIYKLKEYTGGI